MTPPAPPRVYITGLGLVTPLGHGAWATFSALLQGRTIADRAERLLPDTQPMDLVRGLGGVSLARHSATDPAVELAERAAREAITEAGVEALGLPTWLGCSKGAVVAWQRAAEREGRSGCVAASDALVSALGPHECLAQHLRDRVGIEHRSHSVAACASSLTALDRARRALHWGQAQEALVLTAEAALTPLFVHSYRRLGVLAPLTVGGYRARPLDRARSGFMLAEAGVAVVLRALPSHEAPPRGAIELVDTATACEGYDLIRSPPDMSALRHVAQQLFAGRPVSGVHPHAPGTRGHDPAELRVLADVLNAEREMTQLQREVAVYAAKGALGHTLGSAGLLSLVLACLMLRTGKRPPMPWLEAPMADAPVPLRADGHGLDASGHHAVLAAGFGGHTAGALIRRP